MDPIRTVMVGLNLKSAAEPAWRQACEIATAAGAGIIAIHVLRVQTMPEFGDDATPDEDRARERLTALSAPWTAAGGAPFKAVVRTGDPADLLLATAAKGKVDLLVLGLDHKTPLGRFFDDSIRGRMLRECEQPVWITHPVSADRPVRRILCAVDTLNPSRPALKAGARIARLFGARLELLRVLVPGETNPTDARDQLDALRTFTAAFDLSGIEVEYLARSGEPGGRIAAAAEERGSDLLILGSAGRRGLRNWMNRNMPERLTSRLSCSMLSVPGTRTEA